MRRLGRASVNIHVERTIDRFDKDIKDKQLRASQPWVPGVVAVHILVCSPQNVQPKKTSCFLSVFIGKASQGYLAYTQILLGFKFMKKYFYFFCRKLC